MSSPTPANIAKPKRISPADKAKTEIAKKVASSTKSVLKPDYNFRLRSLSRAVVDSVKEEDKKNLRKDLKEVFEYAALRRKALLAMSEADWEKLLENWFDNGK
jgi:hypothetical protein